MTKLLMSYGREMDLDGCGRGHVSLPVASRGLVLDMDRDDRGRGRVSLLAVPREPAQEMAHGGKRREAC